MKKVLFIDRDGTLALEPEDYQLDDLSKLVLSKVFNFLGRIAKEMDYSLVSNQPRWLMQKAFRGFGQHTTFSLMPLKMKELFLMKF